MRGWVEDYYNMFFLSSVNNSPKSPAILLVERLSIYKSRTRISSDMGFVQEDK